jgi:multisubunit Na+/H+ antiporter MnhC subunit
MISSVFIAVAFLVGLGFCALVLKRNLVKIAMAIVVLGSAANLFLVSLGYR